MRKILTLPTPVMHLWKQAASFSPVGRCPLRRAGAALHSFSTHRRAEDPANWYPRIVEYCRPMENLNVHKKKKPKKMQSPAVEHDRFLGYLLMYTKEYAGDTMLEHLASFATTFCKTCTLFVFKNIFCGNFNFFVIYATVTISYEK